MIQPTDSMKADSTAAVECHPTAEGELSTGDCQLANEGRERLNTKTPKIRKQTAKNSPPMLNDEWREKVQEHRRRQEPVAMILDRTFGQFAESHPDLWDRRAFLMMVGVMYQWLEANEKEVSTDELVTLSKMLAEQRRAEAQSSRASNEEEESQAIESEGKLSEDFGEAVKQVYGTNFQETN